MKKNLITELDIAKLSREGRTVLPVGENDILTPLAKDKAQTLGLKIINKEEADKIDVNQNEISSSTRSNIIAIGSDHTGFKIKNLLSRILTEKGYQITDVGTYDEQSCDYPDYAFAVAKKVNSKSADYGIIIDATGIPSAITANKIKGIRAATCYNEFSARSAREHNNANILVVGAKTLGEETIKAILDVFFNTNFGGGRHQLRLDKINALENK